MTETSDFAAKLTIDALGEMLKMFVHTGSSFVSGILQNSEVNDSFGKAARRYINHTAGRFGDFKVLGMPTPKSLETIYTRVRVSDHLRKTSYANKQELSQVLAQRRMPTVGQIRLGVDVINEHNRVTILGRPGAGKTTFLKHLLLDALNNRLSVPCVPVFISLNKAKSLDFSVIDLIEEQFDVCQLTHRKDFVAKLLRDGRCILLLDGLDEVSGADRATINKQIIDLSELYIKCRFVVSCRVASYNFWFESFSDFEVVDFSNADIKNFVTKWFGDKPHLGVECVDQIYRQPGVREFASLPLLLTMICLSFNEARQITSDRAGLYKAAIDQLLYKWDVSRDIDRGDGLQTIDIRRKEDIISYIAASTFESEDLIFDAYRADQLINSCMKSMGDRIRTHINDSPTTILNAFMQSTGLLIEISSDYYSFSHLTFHEYFTARYIVNAGVESIEALVNQYSHLPKWREVVIFVAASLSDANNFVVMLVRRSVEFGCSRQFIESYDSFYNTTRKAGDGRSIVIRSKYEGASWHVDGNRASMDKLRNTVESHKAGIDLELKMRNVALKCFLEFIDAYIKLLISQNETERDRKIQSKNKIIIKRLIDLDNVAKGLSSVENTWSDLTVQLLGEKGCNFLIELLNPAQVRIISEILHGPSTSRSYITDPGQTYEGYITILFDAADYIFLHLGVEPKILFIDNLKRVSAEAIKNDFRRITGDKRFKRLVISELILDILSSQVSVGKSVRQLAISTLCS